MRKFKVLIMLICLAKYSALLCPKLTLTIFIIYINNINNIINI